jgi:threonyl-tRNA synthetase
LELLDFDDPTGKMVFWHSSAHVLGEACERRFGCSLCIGPPIDTGFYYEMALPDGAAVQNSDWKPLETIVSKISKEKQKFERLVMTKDELLEMFKYNKYKVRTRLRERRGGTRWFPSPDANRKRCSNTLSRTRSLMEHPPLSTEMVP